ncbi:MAG TPA: HAD-IB family hydrolase [Nitrospiraceae bacterium]|jgi:HAD superfamily hydrolase (TIGR01490 family)|nr:HAD-IB family hydrolase [Nitrospiraceae bacterium]
MLASFQTSTTGRRAVKIAAFFDVDNTLLPGAPSEVRFFCYLWRTGVVGWREAAASLWWWLRHVPPVSLQPLREQKLYLTGKHPAEMESLAEAFCREEVFPFLSADGLAQLDAHRRQGHAIVLITGSLDFLIQPLAAFLSVTSVLAARPERTPAGFTGRLVDPLPYGDGKRRLMVTFARQNGFDLGDCYAYGDSPGDVEALQAVGHPTVVNPIRGMARIARRYGWPIAKWE